MIVFTVFGQPRGKARPRVVRMKNGRSLTYTPDKTVAYEELVRQNCMSALELDGKKPFPANIPLRLEITAAFSVPKSKPKRDRERMLAGNLFPTKKPDFDNIFKIVCDALNGIAYADDAQIVEAGIRKVYDDVPHIEVAIGEVGDFW